MKKLDHQIGEFGFFQDSPKSILSNGDFFFFDLGENPYLFLIDGSLSPTSSIKGHFREVFFELLSECDNFLTLNNSPLNVLNELHNILLENNQVNPRQKIWASAVLCKISKSSAKILEIAETGDTKVFVFRSSKMFPVFDQNLPNPSNKLSGAMGMHNPKIQTTKLTLNDDEEILLMTDGAYHYLEKYEKIKVSQNGMFLNETLNQFDGFVRFSDDDASLVSFKPKL